MISKSKKEMIRRDVDSVYGYLSTDYNQMEEKKEAYPTFGALNANFVKSPYDMFNDSTTEEKEDNITPIVTEYLSMRKNTWVKTFFEQHWLNFFGEVYKNIGKFKKDSLKCECSEIWSLHSDKSATYGIQYHKFTSDVWVIIKEILFREMFTVNEERETYLLLKGLMCPLCVVEKKHRCLYHRFLDEFLMRTIPTENKGKLENISMIELFIADFKELFQTGPDCDMHVDMLKEEYAKQSKNRVSVPQLIKFMLDLFYADEGFYDEAKYEEDELHPIGTYLICSMFGSRKKNWKPRESPFEKKKKLILVIICQFSICQPKTHQRLEPHFAKP